MSLIEFANVIKFSPGAGNYHKNPELNYKMLLFWVIFFGGFILRIYFLNKIDNTQKNNKKKSNPILNK